MAESTPISRNAPIASTLGVSNQSGTVPGKVQRAFRAALGSQWVGTTSDLGPNQLSYELLLERSESGVASDGGTFIVPASRRPTQVTVVPTMTGTNGPRTDEYLATLRRRKLTALAVKLGELADQGTDERFIFTVDATIKKIEEALQEFAEAKPEGTTREILRTLLNTLRNGGWDRYKNPTIANKIQTFLARIGNVEWIDSEQVEEFHSLVEKLELDSLTLPAAEWPE